MNGASLALGTRSGLRTREAPGTPDAPKPGTEPEYAQRLVELVSGLRPTIFIRNAGEFAGRLI